LLRNDGRSAFRIVACATIDSSFKANDISPPIEKLE